MWLTVWLLFYLSTNKSVLRIVAIVDKLSKIGDYMILTSLFLVEILHNYQVMVFIIFCTRLGLLDTHACMFVWSCIRACRNTYNISQIEFSYISIMYALKCTYPANSIKYMYIYIYMYIYGVYVHLTFNHIKLFYVDFRKIKKVSIDLTPIHLPSALLFFKLNSWCIIYGTLNVNRCVWISIACIFRLFLMLK